jgi:hypothetical protein
MATRRAARRLKRVAAVLAFAMVGLGVTACEVRGEETRRAESAVPLLEESGQFSEIELRLAEKYNGLPWQKVEYVASFEATLSGSDHHKAAEVLERVNSELDTAIDVETSGASLRVVRLDGPSAMAPEDWVAVLDYAVDGPAGEISLSGADTPSISIMDTEAETGPEDVLDAATRLSAVSEEDIGVRARVYLASEPGEDRAGITFIAPPDGTGEHARQAEALWRILDQDRPLGEVSRFRFEVSQDPPAEPRVDIEAYLDTPLPSMVADEQEAWLEAMRPVAEDVTDAFAEELDVPSRVRICFAPCRGPEREHIVEHP